MNLSKFFFVLLQLIIWEITSYKGNEPIVTLVSGFWDIKRGDIVAFNRPISYYLKYFEDLLKTNMRMIIFGDKQLQQFVWNRRNKNNTHFIVKNLSEIRGMWHTPLVHKVINKLKANETFWKKNSRPPQYALQMYNPVIMSKLFLMEEAVQKDIFNADFFIWNDAGMMHNFNPSAFVPQNMIQKFEHFYQGPWYFQCYTIQDIFMGYQQEQYRYVQKQIPKDLVVFANHFGGRVQVVSTMKAVYQNILRLTLSYGDLNTEESVLTLMLIKFPYLIPLFGKVPMGQFKENSPLHQNFYLKLQNHRMFNFTINNQFQKQQQYSTVTNKSQNIKYETLFQFIYSYFSQIVFRLKFIFILKVIFMIILLYFHLVVMKLKSSLKNYEQQKYYMDDQRVVNFKLNQQKIVWNKNIIYLVVVILSTILITTAVLGGSSKKLIINNQIIKNQSECIKLKDQIHNFVIISADQLKKSNIFKSESTLNTQNQSAHYAFQHNPRAQHQIHQVKPWKQPLIGVPSKDKPFNFTVVDQKFLKEYQKKIIALIKPFNDTNCKLQRFNNQHDDFICGNLFSKTEALINIGADQTDQFGCKITSNYTITNYIFNCLLQKIPECLTNKGRNKFQQICLGEVTETILTQTNLKYQFLSLEEIIGLLKLQQKNISLKINLNGGEWAGLRSLPTKYLDKIDHIIIRLNIQNKRNRAYPNLWGNIQILQSLTKQFIPVNIHMDNCIDKNQLGNHHIQGLTIFVTFVNKKNIKINNATRSFQPNKLNNKNPNCQIKDIQ